MDHGSVPFVAGFPAEDLCHIVGRHPAHCALLLHGRAHVGVRSRRAFARTVADLDAVDPPGIYANALGRADLDTGHDADCHRDPQAGRQRHLYLYCHADADAYAFAHRYPYANANGNVNPDPDVNADPDVNPDRNLHRHPDQHTHKYTDTVEHGYRYTDLDPESNAQRHPDANADLHAGPRASSAMTSATGEPASKGRVQNLPPEGDVKPKRLNVQLTERQQVVIGFVLVILVAISMLYCLGFASVALRNAWESGPLPWGENNDYPVESTALPLTPLIEPTESNISPP